MSEEPDNSQNGGFLSGNELKQCVEDEPAIYYLAGEDTPGNEEKKPKPLDDDEWTIDLELGKEVFLTSEDQICFLQEGDSISIDPGEFALLMTEEIVKIPSDKAAFISLKFNVARKGLINISGFHVDPNFEGHIVFSVYNASPSPVIMRRGDPAFMIVFANLTESVERNRDNATFNNPDGLDIEGLEPRWVESIQGRTRSLENLSDEVNTLKHKTAVNRRLLIGIALALFGGVFSLAAAVLIRLTS